MLTEIEFMGKKCIILDKTNSVYVMHRTMSSTSIWQWYVYEIEKHSNRHNLTVAGEVMTEESAFEFYKERMESFGYKPFPVIEE